MPIDRSNAGSNRDVQQQRLPGGPSMRAALAAAKLPFALGDGLRHEGAEAQGVSAVLVIEGTDPGAAVTSLPLSFGVLEMAVGEPGVAVERAMVMRWMSAAFMGDVVPPDAPWEFTLYRKRAASPRFFPVLVVEVATE